MNTTENQKDRLLIIMDENGLSQADLARRTGLSPATFSRFFNNDLEIKRSTLATIALSLGYNPEWLIEGEGDKKPKEPNSGAKMEKGATPWKDAAYNSLQQQVDYLKAQNQQLMELLKSALAGAGKLIALEDATEPQGFASGAMAA